MHSDPTVLISFAALNISQFNSLFGSSFFVDALALPRRCWESLPSVTLTLTGASSSLLRIARLRYLRFCWRTSTLVSSFSLLACSLGSPDLDLWCAIGELDFQLSDLAALIRASSTFLLDEVSESFLSYVDSSQVRSVLRKDSRSDLIDPSSFSSVWFLFCFLILILSMQIARWVAGNLITLSS
jgi:hypothetical protein